MNQSWKPEVFVDNEWAQNNCAFATEEEAKASAFDLMTRWMLVQDYRAVESDQPVNWQIVDGMMCPVTQHQVVFDFDVRG